MVPISIHLLTLHPPIHSSIHPSIHPCLWRAYYVPGRSKAVTFQTQPTIKISLSHTHTRTQVSGLTRTQAACSLAGFLPSLQPHPHHHGRAKYRGRNPLADRAPRLHPRGSAPPSLYLPTLKPFASSFTISQGDVRADSRQAEVQRLRVYGGVLGPSAPLPPDSQESPPPPACVHMSR